MDKYNLTAFSQIYYDQNEGKEYWMLMTDWPNNEGIDLHIREVDRSDQHELAEDEGERYSFTNDQVKMMSELFANLRA